VEQQQQQQHPICGSGAVTHIQGVEGGRVYSASPLLKRARCIVFAAVYGLKEIPSQA